ncbi:MAG: gliding motility-associated C-terminal domain-containing protein [Bacteroidetes bacterium]|nr:gliding motility-associated C-terminal domain-containing protein [Bacteroidota bacterium]
MKSFTNSLRRWRMFLLAVCIILCCGISDSTATHLAGGQITYTYLGNNGFDYRVTYTLYRDCSGAVAPGTVTINTSSVSAGANFNTVSGAGVNNGNVVPICPTANTTCTGGATPGRAEWVYQADITLPSKRTDWVFSVSIPNRNNAITTINPTTVPMYVYATLNNTVNPYNNSSVFANRPAAFVYAGQNFCFNNGTVDQDGDSLAYSLITPKTGAATTVSYIFPYTATQPLASTPPVSFSATNGDVCMTPTLVQVTVMAILVQEYRWGQLIGSVERDIQVSVVAGADNLPYINGINGTNIYEDTIPAGCNYTFTTQSFDADATQCVTMDSANVASMPGATFTITNGCPSFTEPTGTFDWSPVSGDVRSQPYAFTVTVQDDYCNISGQQVRAFSLWVIDFTADFTSNAPACVGQGVNFYSIQPPNNYSYLWDFGVDAVATFAQATSANPAGIAYTSSGAKTVTLTITSSGCSDIVSNVITINPSPTASFTNTVPTCSSDPVNFTNTGSTGAGISYVWDFGNGATPPVSFTENPSGITYGSGGDKIIVFQVSNQFGCISSVTDTITVASTPVADFSFTPPSCTGEVDFFNTGTTGATYSWNLGSGATPATSSVESPQNVAYSSAGTKTVTLITTLGSCSDTSVQVLVVAETPAPAFTHNAPQCEGSAVNFTYTGTSGSGWTYLWDFGVGSSPSTSSQTSPQGILYSGSGSKTVLLTVSNGACADTTTQTFTINQTPVATFTSFSSYCSGDSVDFQNTGTTGATYSWDFGSGATPAASTSENPQDVIYSSNGIKTVTLTTTIGTCNDVSTQTINIYQTPAPSFTHNAPQCEGSAINFTYTGTTDTNWTFIWDFGVGATPSSSTQQNPQSILYSGAGSKTVLLTVMNGTCSEVASASFTINQTPVATFTSFSSYCSGDSVDFQNTGTTGASYSWDFGSGASPASSALENPQDVIYSSNGIKTVTLTTTIGACTDIESSTINIYQTPAPSFTHNAPQCEGSAVNFTYTGTTDTNWTFIWDFGVGATPSSSTQQNPQSILYSGAGSKTVLLTVMNGTCSEVSSATFTINQTPVATFTSFSSYCSGDSVDFQNTGTTGATYSWDFGSGATPAASTSENPQDVVYSSNGIKTVTLTTTIGTCTDIETNTINIYQTPAPSFTHNAPQCEGSAVNFTYIGTTDTNWTYTWDFGVGAAPSSSTQQNPQSILYSGAGSKTVLLTVMNGTCSEVFSATFTINQTPVADFTSISSNCTGDSVDFTNTGTSVSLAIAIENVSDATCNGDCNGTIISSASGGTAPYTYLWSNGQITPTATGLCAGTYAVTVTDFAGVSTTVSDSISEPALLSALISNQTNVSCNGGNDGSVDIAVTGGVSTYTFIWSNSAITEDITGVAAGTYTLTVTDANECTTNQSTAIIQPTAITSSTGSTDATCSIPDGSASVTSSGGSGAYIYIWPDAQTTSTATGLTAGAYTVTVTDTVGCTNIATAYVNNTAAPSITLDMASTLNCSYDCNGTAAVSASGGTPPYTFLWNDLSATANDTVVNLCTGTYTVAVTDNAGCLSYLSTTINASAAISVLSLISNVSCNGDTNGTIDITVAGGVSPYTYNWSDSSITEDISDLSPATYTVTVTDANACTASLTGIVTEPGSLSASISSSPAMGVNCNGSAIVSGNGGTPPYSYLWSNSSTAATINNLCAGTYSVTITDANGCTNTATDTIANSVSGVPVYSWDFGSGASPATSVSENPANVVYSTAGTKTVRLIITLGSCSDTAVQTINIYQTPAPSFTHNAPQCEGAAVNFTYTGTTDTNWTFLWDFGTGASPSTSSQKNPPGVTYSGGGSRDVLITAINGFCSEVSEQTINIYSLPAINPGSDTTICANTCVTIGSTAVSGITYNWTDPDNTLSATNIANPVACPEGIITVYHLKVTDTSGCINRDSVNVVMLLPLKADAGSDVEICFGDSVQIGTGLIQGQIYSWSPSAGLNNGANPNPIAKSDSTTTYKLTVMDDYGCTPVTDEVLVTVHPLPDAEATDIHGKDTSRIMPGNSIGLMATGGLQYVWQPVKGLDFAAIADPVSTPDSTINYIVTVTDIHGCTNTDTVRIEVADSIEVFIPTVFTPDGNGVNDVLYARGTGKGGFVFRIFDRWGGQIFISDDPLTGWNGNRHNSGDEMPDGAYVYTYEVTDMEGKTVKGSGIVNLVR